MKTKTARAVHRVLLTTDTVGGVWTHTLDLCRGLEAEGVDVILATMGPGLRPDQREEMEELRRVELCESQYRLEWMEDPWDDVARAGEWLLDLERRFNPDIIHLNGYAHGALPWSSPVVVAAHSCVLSWWRAAKGEAAPPAWHTYQEAVANGIRKADIVVAPTQWMLDSLSENYGAPSDGRVVPNGREASRFFHSFTKEPFILCVGRLWDEAKNVRALTEVAPELPWPVRVAGDLRGPDGREEMLRNVETLGRCSQRDLARLYAHASVFALPARYEPFGLSALEAALSGCALVLGDIPSLRETWENAALFVPPDDHEAIRSETTKLIHDPLRLKRLAGAARKRGRKFTAEKMVENYVAIYGELAARRTELKTGFPLVSLS
jgi:glycosyltransferase involved in cell wall biosynthesis